MPKLVETIFEPRRLPVQARSAASVEAILQATVQVLLSMGKDRLTTTRVAARAGVSVGTLYQYFPNKSALLQAALKRHLMQVTETVEAVCRAQEGGTLDTMIPVLVRAFLDVKTREIQTSRAMYAVSADVDGARVVQSMGNRSTKAIVRVLTSAKDPLASDVHLVASVLQGMLAGVARRMLESSADQEHLAAMGQELVRAACAYVGACRQF